MRKFKTAEDNRTNYIYYFDDGSKCVITPGENGENTTIISQLHALDDEQLDADRREDYHCPVHYQAYSDGEGEDADDRLGGLAGLQFSRRGQQPGDGDAGSVGCAH